MQRNKENASIIETGRKDIFSFLLTAKDPETGDGLPMPELMMEGNTLIVAGSDTSSTTLSAILYYPLRNPYCLQRLTTEVRQSFSHEEDIRVGPKLRSCTYLRACIDEAMRMTPAVADLLPRVVLPGGLQISALDLDILAGVDVGVCTYAIQHYRDYIVEPFKYDPGRWLAKDPNEGSMARSTSHRSDSGISLRRSASPPEPTLALQIPGRAATSADQDRDALLACFAPFSLGHRACLGKPLVYMELSIAVARLVWNYDMRLIEKKPLGWRTRRDVKLGRKHRDEHHTQDWFLGDKKGPWVEIAAVERV
jgi:cytochrome P450